jgi:hypothetical protein
MNLRKPLGGFVALGVVATVVGAAVVLATNASEDVGTAGFATVALVALVVAGLAGAGMRSREWLSGQYW